MEAFYCAGAAMKWLVMIGGAVAAVGLFLPPRPARTPPSSCATIRCSSGWLRLPGLLAALVATQLVLLARGLRARVFGARLTLRLLARFAALAVVPWADRLRGFRAISTRSIESWFDVKVDERWRSILRSGRSSTHIADLQRKANAMAVELAEHSPAARRPARAPARPARRRGGRRGHRHRQAAAAAAQDVAKLVPELPTGHALRQARIPGPTAQWTRRRPAAGPARRRAARPARRGALPATAAKRAGIVRAQRRGRRSCLPRLPRARNLARGTKRIYVVPLTFALLMALFVAVAAAATSRACLPSHSPISRRRPGGSARRFLAPPLGHQPRRTRRSHRVFQLDDAAAGGGAAASSRTGSPLEAAKARLENILANMSAGVLVFDHELRCRSPTTAPRRSWARSSPRLPRADRANSLRGARRGRLAARAPARAEQDAARARRAAAAGDRRRRRGRVRRHHAADPGQRATAWAEVARRLAHEIKNPLTPIQLSAERLEMKLPEAAAREAGCWRARSRLSSIRSRR